MSFCKSLYNMTTTENGAMTYKSSNNATVDWFFHGAALRNEMNEDRIIDLFSNALNEDVQTALRILFYIRDIRGGQGERRVFRTCLEYFAGTNTNWLIQNLHLIPEYGRWDDVISLIGNSTELDNAIISLLSKTLSNDLENLKRGKPISLLAKWMPSENTSSKETRNLANFIRSNMGKTPKAYRKMLSNLRRQLDIVERKLSAKECYTINYPNLPSKAGMKYRKAFNRNDGPRYQSYLNSLKKGETKINTSTLYPYELLEQVWRGDNSDTINLMWKNLPDYIPNLCGLVVADTSGSMSCWNNRPMAVSVSLAMYIAERNKNEAWKDYFISFSRQPKLHKIKGNTLSERARSVQLGDVDSTNIQGVFDLVLDRAIKNKVPQEEMPQILLIISDMEFDSCAENSSSTNFEVIRSRYAAANLPMPTLAFWNVASRNTQSPIQFNEQGVVLLSGCSPVVFKYALGNCKTPLEMVYNVVNADRYKVIIWK